jgi:shikimate dehydrogenase
MVSVRTPPHARALTKDTEMCISLAGRPSNIGTRFHNFLYAELALDFVYKAFTTDDLAGAITGVRALAIRGCGVSMPFKEAVIPLVDSLDASAAAIRSVNTVVNTGGHLRGYNTDYIAITHLLRERRIPTSSSVAVRGSGGMAQAVVAALRDGGFGDVTVVARNPETGPALAGRYGASWVPALSGEHPDILVNATPIGMAGGPHESDVPFDDATLRAAEVVVDVVALPIETPFVRRARELDLPVITGAEVIALQAAEQFTLYTGVRPSEDLVQRASEYSLA